MKTAETAFTLGYRLSRRLNRVFLCSLPPERRSAGLNQPLAQKTRKGEKS